MKRNLIINYILIISLFFSCQENKKETIYDGYTINGVTSTANNKVLYLINKENTIVDSSAIRKNSFNFKGKISSPENYYFKFKDDQKKYAIILENEIFIVAIHKDQSEVFGGNLNTKLKNFKSSIKTLDEEKTTILSEIALSNKKYKEFEKALLLIDEKKENLTLGFIKENTNNLLATNVLSESDNLVLEDLLQIQNASKDVKNTSFAIALNAKIEEFKKIAADKLAKEKAALALKKAYRKPAIMFSGEGLDANDVFLQEIIKGKKAVLIDFWASWCGPCRVVTPSIKRLYTKYKDKGFTILTVSEDKDKVSWRKGIEEDGMLEWNHIYDDFSRISNMHNIKAIPYMILIDGKGRVIKENITYTQLTKELKKICK